MSDDTPAARPEDDPAVVRHHLDKFAWSCVEALEPMGRHLDILDRNLDPTVGPVTPEQLLAMATAAPLCAEAARVLRAAFHKIGRG